MSWFLYYFGLLPGLIVLMLVFKTKTYYEDDNRQNGRLKGGTILISNHRSFMDPIVIVLRFFFHKLHFIVADFYKNKLKMAKSMMENLGGILVDMDGQNLDFIEKSRRIIAKGGVILMFPEGDFKYAYEPQKFFAGYIMLAIKTGAKILPIVNDFNYGLFKRVHLMIGNSIDLSRYKGEELTKEMLKEINDEISGKYMTLFYKLKRKKAERFSNKYEFISPKKCDIIRIFAGSHYHYGVYLNAGEVIQFGHAVNMAGEKVVVNSVSLNEFCGSKIPEVRTLRRSEKRFIRNADDIERYAKSCLGQGGYSLANNNCLDFANRVTLKI
jgi:1-acyl-sn-glycerol-3-phosphate acyltransferase